MKKINHKTKAVIASVLLVVLAIVLALSVFSLFISGEEYGDTYLFGFKPYAIKSESMSDKINKNDLIIIKRVDPATLVEGDIISFRTIEPNTYGEIITHEISGLTNYNYELAFWTKSFADGIEDTYPVPYDKIIGKYLFKIPSIGGALSFVNKDSGFMLLVGIPLFILFSLQLWHVIRTLSKIKDEEAHERYKKIIDKRKSEAEESIKVFDDIKEKTEDINKIVDISINDDEEDEMRNAFSKEISLLADMDEEEPIAETSVQETKAEVKEEVVAPVFDEKEFGAVAVDLLSSFTAYEDSYLKENIEPEVKPIPQEIEPIKDEEIKIEEDNGQNDSSNYLDELVNDLDDLFTKMPRKNKNKSLSRTDRYANLRKEITVETINSIKEQKDDH